MKMLKRLVCLIVAICLAVMSQLSQVAKADDLVSRSIKLNNPSPSVLTEHIFRYTLQSSSNVGSIVFEYCTNNPFVGTVCDAPAGLDTSAPTIVNQSGETGFSIISSTANKIILVRSPAPTAPGESVYTLGNIINPADATQTVYVRISLHASTDGSGEPADDGGLAFSLAKKIDTVAYVPPFLLFCTGVTVDINCKSANGVYINLGELTPASPRSGQSQYAGGTNDESGFAVTVIGTTMTSGNDVILALNQPAPSREGTSQFGINLRANTVPAAGAEPIGVGTAAIHTDYATPNRFKFKSGDTLTSVYDASDFNRFTVTYLVNVGDEQQPGIYAATFTYVATASF